MDNAVALVQAYLRVNGYFTVAEYPVLESTRGSGYRTSTDLDILAFRFPSAGRLIARSGSSAAGDQLEATTDPALKAPAGRADMVVGEVKEGRARLNEAATHPSVLRSALVRFGCCSAAEAPTVVSELLRDGRAVLPVGHQIRLIAFGSTAGPQGKWTVVTLSQVVTYLQDYVREYWDVLRHVEEKDPAFGMLVLLEKVLRS